MAAAASRWNHRFWQVSFNEMEDGREREMIGGGVSKRWSFRVAITTLCAIYALVSCSCSSNALNAVWSQSIGWEILNFLMQEYSTECNQREDKLQSSVSYGQKYSCSSREEEVTRGHMWKPLQLGRAHRFGSGLCSASLWACIVKLVARSNWNDHYRCHLGNSSTMPCCNWLMKINR